MNHRISILLLIVFFSLGVLNAQTTGAAPKTYTQEEFDTAVVKEVERRLLRLGKKEIINFSKELMEKEKKLNVRNDYLDQREQAIKLSSVDLAKKIKQLEESQSKLLSCLDQSDQQKKDRIRHMVETISGMKPQNAADLLSVQEAELAVEILAALESAKVSKIFNMMDKEISARLQKQYMTMKR